MTSETYPIHRCIFRNDVDELNKILKEEDMKKLINSKDNHGNTPIHLALMLDRRNCVLSLIRNGCDCVSRNNYGWNPLEEATMLGDMDLIEKLSYLKLKAYDTYFNKKGGTMDNWNEIFPYCYFRTQIKFKSKIPLLDKVGIKDIQKLYKRGTNFRADYGFSGIDLRGIPRMIKGSMSVITNLENGRLTVYLLDNKAKRYTEIYPSVPQNIIESYLKSKMDVKTLFKFYCDFTDLNIKKKSSKGSLFSNSKKRTIRINGNKKYNTDIYKFKDVDVIIRKRDNEELIGDYKSHIKTTVQDLDKSRNRMGKSLTRELNETLFSGAESQIKGYVMEDLIKQEKELSGTDSDSSDDESDVEDAKSETNSERSTEKLNEPDTEFKKFIDENILSITDIGSDINDKVVRMVIRGSDDNGNPIIDSDILYINKLIPSFYTTYLKGNHLSAEEQKKLEEIYNRVVKANNTSSSELSDDSKMMQNLKKSSNVAQMVHNLAGSVYNSNKKSKAVKYEETKKESISEEEYFNPENKESIHMGRVMEINEEKKHLKNAFKVWLTKENAFPLNCTHIKPFIDIMCLILFDQVNIKVEDNDSDRTAYYNSINFILKEVNGNKRFPLKMEIPIYASTSFQCKFIDLETDEKYVPESLFKVPSDYAYDESVSFKFIN